MCVRVCFIRVAASDFRLQKCQLVLASVRLNHSMIFSLFFFLGGGGGGFWVFCLLLVDELQKTIHEENVRELVFP